MADLIAVLIAALAQLLGAGGDAQILGVRMAALIVEAKPVPLSEAAVEAEGVGASGVELLSMKFTDLLLDPLEIDATTIDVSGISVAPAGVSLEGIEFSAEISEADLTSALRKHTTALDDARIHITKQALELSGTYPLFGLRLPYRVAGTLSVKDDTRLMFNIDSSGMGAVRSPAALNSLIEREINPVYDLAEFAARSKDDIELAREQLDYEFNLEIVSITLGQGHIIVAGTA
jgi:hypothetical protein